MALTFGSLFAGVGGFDLGLERDGMKCMWQVENDKACNRILRKHCPDVPRWEDVREFTETTTAIRPDLICGGFPCQDLSVAGNRAGLAGKRSGLFFEFMRIVKAFAPRWILVENVPGLLSSSGGRDMGAVLGRLAELGYGTAYRVLDAQWFGVPQRRRRVFIIGYFGGTNNETTMRELRGNFRGPIRDGRRGTGAVRMPEVRKRGRSNAYPDWRRAAEVLFEPESLPWDSPPSREEGTRVAEKPAGCLNSGGNNGGFRTEPGEHLVIATGLTRRYGKGADSDATDALITMPFDTTQITSDKNYSNPQPGDPCHPLAAGQHPPAVACGVPFVPYTLMENGSDVQVGGMPHLRDGHTSGVPRVVNSMAVRRLTPRECERLQGFPDDWTRYDDEGTEIADGPRYRMLGNAVAVPVAEWIGRRIVEAESRST